MANIRPFRALRPAVGKEKMIAALPYDVYNREEAKKIVEQNPMSFLAIDRAETGFDDSVSTYDEKVYLRAKDLLIEKENNGDFIKDEKEMYYIYALSMNGRTQHGIVGCASIDDYMTGNIKKHENTREEKEQDRIRHVDTCSAQTGPIFLAYRNQDEIKSIIREICETKPIYDFESDDAIRHQVWQVNEEQYIKKISKIFDSMNYLYIADGHHRCASAVKVGLKRREELKNQTNNKSKEIVLESDYFLSVIFPDDELLIMDYNRVIKDLNGHTEREILELLSKNFDINENGTNQVKPDKKGTFGMFLGKRWYKLVAKPICFCDNPVDDLDVSILQKECLLPIFDIKDPKTDSRIDFVGGIRGIKELEKRCNKDAKVAFSMYPTSISELFQVADANQLMPPKSTWFEPKLRSGLFIHQI